MEGNPQREGGGKMNVGVLLWTSLRSRFCREFNSPELECGQGFSG